MRSAIKSSWGSEVRLCALLGAFLFHLFLIHACEVKHEYKAYHRASDNSSKHVNQTWLSLSKLLDNFWSFNEVNYLSLKGLELLGLFGSVLAYRLIDVADRVSFWSCVLLSWAGFIFEGITSCRGE